jgi:hypothetical protein
MVTGCLVAAALLFSNASIPTQQERIVPGSLGDLKGTTTVFVDTGADMQLRAAIVERLAKELPGLAIVERPDAAALVLRYSTSVGDRVPDRVFSSTKSILSHQTDPDHQSGRHDSRPAGLSRRDSPPIIRVPEHQRDVERIAPQPPRPGHLRYGHGVVLRSNGDQTYAEAMRVTRRLGSPTRAARDFVKRFAKEYRKVNGR